MDPGLITVAHGTRRPGGNEVARRITAAAGVALGVDALAAYVDLGEPLLADVVPDLEAPTPVVPLLLSTGFHVRVDLPAACATGPAALGRPLGPDPSLALAQVDRLLEAGAAPGCSVVMVAAGSTDPVAMRDLRRAADLLAEGWGAHVRLATLGGRGVRPDRLIRPGDAVSPYLLSPGLFSARLAEMSRDSGATCCAEVIGAHPSVVDLVIKRAELLRLPQAVSA